MRRARQSNIDQEILSPHAADAQEHQLLRNLQPQADDAIIPLLMVSGECLCESNTCELLIKDQLLVPRTSLWP